MTYTRNYFNVWIFQNENLLRIQTAVLLIIHPYIIKNSQDTICSFLLLDHSAQIFKSRTKRTLYRSARSRITPNSPIPKRGIIGNSHTTPSHPRIQKPSQPDLLRFSAKDRKGPHSGLFTARNISADTARQIYGRTHTRQWYLIYRYHQWKDSGRLPRS